MVQDEGKELQQYSIHYHGEHPASLSITESLQKLFLQTAPCTDQYMQVSIYNINKIIGDYNKESSRFKCFSNNLSVIV